MTDLSKLATRLVAERGKELVLKSPIDGDPIKNEDGSMATLIVAGADSLAVQQAILNVARRSLELTEDEKHDVAKQAELRNDMHASVVLGMSGIYWEGAEMQYSRENVLKLLDACPWIGPQIDEFSSTRANFFEA
jgi:hypothetical protein